MTDFVSGPVRVRAPASSANLGPGFDALGLALDLADELTAQVSGPAGSAVRIAVVGEGAGSVALDETHLVHRAMTLGFSAMDLPTPGLHLRCENAVPHGRGLGSSSAAIVGGLVLARELVADGHARLSDERLFAAAADLEGHPDNVAAAFYGGLTIAYGEPGDFRAVRLDVLPATSFVVFVPPGSLETTVARGLLPSTVPYADAVRNAGRAALLVAALTSCPDRLMAATEDRLHQQYRSPAMPDSAALIESLRGDGYAAVVSGAGPSVLAMVPPREAAGLSDRAPEGWQVLELSVDRAGARRIP